ncbi:Maf family protein [Sneathiella marina]|uniref:dTTP/UTP pyrophosphatase n=1 Tax=Sneathiella marina TaxID=2950108 RepID=A0ABY4W4T1_9PROT|nr:nucleoside triphosphate pyrophosphatase [Sneathiella marina]USG62043.1 Maf family protein [Sneathiella marina]
MADRKEAFAAHTSIANKDSTSATLPTPSLVLASASPRRLSLLKQIGVIPDIVSPADIDEAAHKDELPRDTAKRLSQEKAHAVFPQFGGKFLLAADTVVAVGRRALNKAENEEEAYSFLKLLSGRRHQVHTGVTLAMPNETTISRLVSSSVVFKALSEHELRSYIQTEEWRGKAGGYAIQGRAASFVRSIQGSYSNVVGLPLFEVSNMLIGNGFDIWTSRE